MLTEKFYKAIEQVYKELARYSVKLVHPAYAEPDQNSMYVILDPDEVGYCWADNMTAFVEFGIGSTQNVYAIHGMITAPKPDITEVTIKDAEQRLGRLVYSILSDAGFSLSWDGDILSPILLNIEEEFFVKEDE